jgi:alpha-galactosidase
MTLWSEMAAPLIISTDLEKASPAALRVLGNRRVIAVDQDWLGVQGHIVARGHGFDVLTKPLVGGARSVVLFDSAPTGSTLSTTARAAGLPLASRYSVTDLVTGARVETAGRIAAGLPGHGTTIDRVTAGAPAGLPSAATVTLTRPHSAPGIPEQVSATVRNDGNASIAGGQLRLSAPSWVTVRLRSVDLPHIAPGHSAIVRVPVMAGPPPAGRVTSDLVATASYRSGRGHATATGHTGEITTTPYPTLAAAFNDVGVSSQSNPAAGNFDGYDDSFSAQALAAAGVTPGSTVRARGAVFTWPTAPAGTVDNVQGSGATIDLSGTGSELAFLGAEYGSVRGQVVVTYSDGSSSTARLGFPDWCCSAKHRYGASPAIVMDHYDFFTGPEHFGTHYDIYDNSVPIDPGKTVASVTLPSNREIHVFAMTLAP